MADPRRKWLVETRVGWQRTSTRRVSVVLDGLHAPADHEGDAKAEYLAAHTRARCFSTSTTSRMRHRPCRTCCPRPEKFAGRK